MRDDQRDDPQAAGEQRDAARHLLMNPIKRSMEKNMLKVYEGKTKLLFSQLKESDAAVLGASALAWKELEK